MEIFYEKKHIRRYMIGQIIELFAANYGKYHYERLRTYDGMVSLIRNTQFDCVFIIEEGKVCGFAGYYVKTELYYGIKEILLPHLLIDINSRGKGYGNLLEDIRLKMIQKLGGDKLIYASCVEKPYNSVKMKQHRGFFTGGFRYHYRHGKYTRENAVIMIYTGNLQQEIFIETSHVFTERLLKIGNSKVKFKECESDDRKHLIEIEENEQLGRRICHVLNLSEGIVLDEKCLNKVKSEEDYVGVYVCPSIDGFKHIDNLLVSNSFFPLSYIPYLKGGYGILEYQYLPDGILGLLKDEEISQAGRELIKYLYE